MTSAARFISEINARETLIRLGEHLPWALTIDSITKRLCIGAKTTTTDTDTTISFVDGSIAHRDASGWFEVVE